MGADLDVDVCPTPRYVLFDTNIFLDVANGRIGPNECRQAEQALRPDGLGRVSTLSVIELGCGLNDQQKWHRYALAFQAVVALCSRALPDPSFFFRREILKLETCTPAFESDGAWRLCEHVAAVDSHASLCEWVRRKDQQGRDLIERAALVALPDVRASYESSYIARVGRLRELLLNRTGTISAPSGKPVARPGPTRERWLQELDSNDFGFVFLALEAHAIGVPLIGQRVDRDADAVALITPFLDALRSLLRAAVVSDYNIEKHKNDFVDILLLLHLADERVLFVTNDRRLRERIPSDATYGHRIVDFKGWLAQTSRQTDQTPGSRRIRNNERH
ncbi:MAG: hypothetical protein U0610_21685 [bacterium]